MEALVPVTEVGGVPIAQKVMDLVRVLTFAQPDVGLLPSLLFKPLTRRDSEVPSPLALQLSRRHAQTLGEGANAEVDVASYLLPGNSLYFILNIHID